MRAERPALPGLLLLSVSLLAACGSEEGELVLAPSARPAPLEVPAGPWEPVTLVAARAAVPPEIDGRLDDPAWAGAPPSPPFVDIRGGEAPAPRFATRVRALWDDLALYVGAELEEPHLQGLLTARDSYIWQEDNDFELFLDPDHDTHDYVELEVNALGTVWDLFLDKPYRDGGRARDDWDVAGLETAVHLGGTLNDPSDVDRGWSVEFRVPFAALAEVAGVPCPPGPGDLWRVNFSRVEWRFRVEGGRYVKDLPSPRPGDPVDEHPEDNWVFSPQGLVNVHYPERWGFLWFSPSAVPAEDPCKVRDEDRAREALREVYYFERDHLARTGSYAPVLPEAFRTEASGTLGPRPEVVLRPGGYEAFVALPDGRRMVIREDGWVGWAAPVGDRR